MNDTTTPTTTIPISNASAPTKNDAVNGSVDDTPLFSSSLISAEVSSQLPEGYSIRPLRKSDYNGGKNISPRRGTTDSLTASSRISTPSTITDIFPGFLPTLRVLTTVGDFSEEAFNARYDFMASRNDTYYVLVVCDETETVVGTGGVVVERKFIHNLGLVGHIEDIAVAKNQQGKKLGLRIIQALDHVAEKVGCYKSILDCSEANEGFYVKCGFKRAGLEMAHYYEQASSTS
jgi:glucosamine-phosphate N-acetyltransferase